MTTTSNSIYLRDSLNYDPEKPNNRNNLVAFSPDILPLYQTKVHDVDQLTSDYDNFVAQTVVPEEDNYLYIRGRASNPDAIASGGFTVASVTNELILWPQVLKAATQIGASIILGYDPDDEIKEGGAPAGVTASLRNVDFNPENKGGRHDALLAYRGNNAFSNLKDAANFKQLLSSIGSSADFAFLNTRIADPVFDVYSWATRLRFFDDSNGPISLHIDVEAIGIPTGLEVIIYSTDPNLNLARSPIVSGHRIGTSVNVIHQYDNLLSIEIIKTDPSLILPDSASVSIVASISQGSKPPQAYIVLGAEHVVFDASIRLARMVVGSKLVGGTAVGFYFRDALGDTDTIPRNGSYCWSPDIQPYGPTPDANFATDFAPSNYDTDISSGRGNAAGILSESANYIYLRGNTNAPTHVETSLYAIPCALLIYPENYAQHQVMEIDGSGNAVGAIREMTLPTPGPIAIDNPFNLFNPPNPNGFGSDHYCLIAEARLWAADAADKPLWPHQATLSTGADVTRWILGTPTVAQRNTAYFTNPSAPSQTWQANVTIPDKYPSNTNWSLKLACSNMPLNGVISMTATGDINLNVDKTKISNPNMDIGVDFTGVVGPYSMTVTLSWWQDAGNPISASDNSSLQALLEINIGSASALGSITRANQRSHESSKFHYVVGHHYPNLTSHNKTKRGSHLSVKGAPLLGKAHPMKEIPAPGRYHGHQLAALQRPSRWLALGGDKKSFH